MKQLDSTILLRAVAIVAVVFGHFGLQPLSGGALFLLTLAGYNFVQFTMPKLSTAGDSSAAQAEALLKYGWKIFLPTILYIAAITVLTGSFSWTSFALVTEITGTTNDVISYWFIELLLQLFLLFSLALIFVAPLRNQMLRFPYKFFVMASLIAFVVRLVTMTTIHDAPLNQLVSLRFPHLLFFAYFMGAMAGAAQTTQQRLGAWLVGLLICVESIFTSFGDDFTMLFIAYTITIWLPTLPVPKPATPIIKQLAFSSLFIYLVHFQVFQFLDDYAPELPALVGAGLALAVGIVATRTWKARHQLYGVVLPRQAETLRRWA